MVDAGGEGTNLGCGVHLSGVTGGCGKMGSGKVVGKLGACKGEEYVGTSYSGPVYFL